MRGAILGAACVLMLALAAPAHAAGWQIVADGATYAANNDGEFNLFAWLEGVFFGSQADPNGY